jgi:hypothetical protein
MRHKQIFIIFMTRDGDDGKKCRVLKWDDEKNGSGWWGFGLIIFVVERF